MTIFIAGDRVKVVRVKKEGEYGYANHYPKIGWTGTLEHYYSEWNEFSIKWDKKFNVKYGNLIKLWMIEKIGKEEVKTFGIVKFLESIK